MDKQPSFTHHQCVVCGEKCGVVSNVDDPSIRLGNTRLFSIFLRCVSTNNDEIDSSIFSELDSAVNSCNNEGLVFCNTCTIALMEWDQLYECLYVVIPQRLNRIKFTFYAKMLNNSDKIDSDTGKNIADHHDGVSDGHLSLLFVQKIQQVKDQICRHFSPRVNLNGISDDRSDSGKASKDFANSFENADEFEEFSEIQNDDDEDDFMEYPETKEDRLSVDNEPVNAGTDNKAGKKPSVRPNTVSKLIGPGKFLYRDKFVFFQRNNKFECGECSAVTTRRKDMVRHMGQKHMQAEEKRGLTKSFPKLIGPGKFLYQDKHLFFQNNNSFQCAECSAVTSRRKGMLHHIRVKHMQMFDEVKELNCYGYRLTADEDGLFCCPGCHCQRKKSHIYKHLGELRKKQHSRSKASEVSFKADLTPEHEKILVLPLEVEINEDPVGLTNIFETENNLEQIDTISNNATENSSLVNTCEESGIFSTEILPRRSLRERRPADVPADLVDVDNSGSEDDDDDREMASVGSAGDDGNDMEINSVPSGIIDGGQVRKRSNVNCAKRGESNEKSTIDDDKGYELVSSGPDEWIYADKYKIIFNSEEERYYCGLCCAVHSKRAGLVKHIREKHIEGKFTKKDPILRPTGPNEYTYRERYKVTVDKNDDWYCGECGAQRKDKVNMLVHIRKSHIDQRKIPRKFRTFDEVAPNEFLHNGKYSFRFDPDQELYLCSLCDYTSAFATGVVAHIRNNHYTDAEKQLNRAVEVAPGEYLYGGRYKIRLENGRYRCTLCNRTSETLSVLYPHFRVVHPVGTGEAEGPSQKPPLPPRKYAAQKPIAPDADKTAGVAIPEAKKERMRQIKERLSLRKAISKGWKIQGNGKWVYKNNWQVMVQDGKYKCLACDVEEGDRKAAFKHVQSFHAKEPYVVKPSAPVGCDEVTELEYEGVKYKYDPFENKYTCSLCNRCNVKGGNRSRIIDHIKQKHIDPQKFICDICGQEYDSKLNFRYHRARHEGPKYACKHCGKQFTADRYLRTHLKIHLGEDAKKHQCEFCGKKFFSLKQLKNHRPTHTGENPFPCDLCGESFPSTSKRREHRKKFHGGLPQKHGWTPTEGDMAVQLVYSRGENLNL